MSTLPCGGSRGGGDFLDLLLERGGGPEGAGPPSSERAGDPQQAGRGPEVGGAGRRRRGAAGGGDAPQREGLLHLHGVAAGGSGGVPRRVAADGVGVVL